jgi:hypothetical protein
VSPARLARLGLWAAIALALAGSCSGCPTPQLPCGFTNCTGCCDFEGVCRPGNSSDQCGLTGVMCKACDPGLSCTLGSCRPGFGTGGGGQGGGGDFQCNASTCFGCCNGPTECLDMSVQSPEQCGRLGNPCQPCPGGACNQGSCATSCDHCTTGCCDDNFLCQPGNTEAHCGLNGNTCASCVAPAQSCVFGACFPGIDGGGTGGGSATGGGAGGGGGGGGATNCTPIELGALADIGAYDANNNAFAEARGPGSPFDQLVFLLRRVDVGNIPYSESYGPQTLANTCRACVTYFEGCEAPDGGPLGPGEGCSGAGFLAVSGGISVSTASPSGMSGGTSDLTLVEWNFSLDNPRPQGRCLTLSATAFNVQF